MQSGAAAHRGAALRDRALAERHRISRTVSPGTVDAARTRLDGECRARKRSTANRPRKAHAQKLASFT